MEILIYISNPLTRNFGGNSQMCFLGAAPVLLTQRDPILYFVEWKHTFPID